MEWSLSTTSQCLGHRLQVPVGLCATRFPSPGSVGLCCSSEKSNFPLFAVLDGAQSLTRAEQALCHGATPQPRKAQLLNSQL